MLKSGSFSTEGEEAIVLVTADTAYGKVQGTERKQGLSYVATTLEHQVAATSTDTNWTKVEDEEETNNSTNTNQTHRWVLAAFDTRVNQELVDESGFIISNPYRMLLIESNNLNKRIGDLRDNPYAQGSWIRVFNGMDGGKGVENRYTNIQLGYDYAFGLVGAKSYTGLALSTSIVDVKGNQYSGKANTYSLALYNSYIADNGWYVDAIAKYLYTDQKMTPSGTSRETQFGNHAYSLGLEVGHKEYIQDSNFFIESQLELIAVLVQGVDHIYAGRVGGLDIYGNLRTTPGLSTREGIVTGYTLKTQNNKFQADFRLGLSLVQEFVSNKDSVVLNDGITQGSTAIDDDQRVVLNLGTNLMLTDEWRVYIDAERSFGGNRNTNYQANVGARFSFGKTVKSLPVPEKDLTPLKLQNKAEKK